MTLKETLQAKYSDVIQEVGIKNKADEIHVKQLVSLCPGLLSDEKAQDTTITAAIAECDKCLAELKTLPLTKLDEGTNYPAGAFAYVPDELRPATWKLRLWESNDKKVTKAQLGKASAALSPGGLKGVKADILEADLSGVKRVIRSEYKKLEVSDEDIPRWVKESESRQLISDFQPLTEAVANQNGEGLLTIIKPGFNAGKGRYYPKEVLARDFGIFEGAKMYADHPSENDEKQRPERSIRDWVATLGKPFLNAAGEVQSKFTVVEPWLEGKLAKLREKGMLKELGVSINAIGSASDATIEGTKTKLIERLIRARSVDFVTEPGAGGIVNVFESVDPTVDIDLIEVGQIKERRPDIVRLLEAEIEAKNKQEAKDRMELAEENKTLKESNATLTTENADLKAKITEAGKVKVKADAQALIKEAIVKATLPEAAKARLTEQFKEAEKADGIDIAIKSEGDYIAKLTEAGKPRGVGPTNLPEASVDADKVALKESFKRSHPTWTEKQLDNAVSGR